MVGAQLAERFRIGRGNHVATEHQIGAARRDADRMDIVRRGGETKVRIDHPVLLRETGNVEHGHALLFQVRRHAQDRADGDDARAADAGDDHVIGITEIDGCGLR
jgi:nitric oxide reductase activation protein